MNVDDSTAIFAARLVPRARPQRAFQGWKLIFVLALATAGLIVIKPGVLHFAYPAMALVVGAALYRKSPIDYVSFTLWLYFLSPLIRRVVDYRSSWMNPSPIVVTPLLVTGITVFFLLKHINRFWFRREIWPFILAVTGVSAGLLVGLAMNPKKSDALISYLNWVFPICFGFYLAYYPFQREALYRRVRKTFVYGVLIMGAYGIYQYFEAPVWDCNWLDLMTDGDVGVSVMGRPEPFALRVWSTMNSPGPLSTALSTGLLLIFIDNSFIRFPAAIFGFVSFLLSLVRSGWIGWVGGLIATFTSRRMLSMRTILTAACGLILLAPILLYEPIAHGLQNRLQTFQSISDDQSATDRLSEYSNLADDIVDNPLGLGLTHSDRLNGYVLDSTLLRLPLQLGWIGSMLYIIGLGLVVRRMFPLSGGMDFPIVARAIALSVLIRAPFGQILVGLDGFILWMFCGLVIGRAETGYSNNLKRIK